MEELAGQLIDPEDIVQRFIRERIRGIGQATRELVRTAQNLGEP